LREERLLKRLQAIEKEPERRGAMDPGREIISILGYLEKILNSRQGNSQIANDFGMPDFTNLKMFGSESVSNLEHDLKRVIQKYEPRLVNASVQFQPQEDDILDLRFKISGKLASNNDYPVSFNTVINGDGQITLEK